MIRRFHRSFARMIYYNTGFSNIYQFIPPEKNAPVSILFEGQSGTPEETNLGPFNFAVSKDIRFCRYKISFAYLSFFNSLRHKLV